MQELYASMNALSLLETILYSTVQIMLENEQPPNGCEHRSLDFMSTARILIRTNVF